MIFDLIIFFITKIHREKAPLHVGLGTTDVINYDKFVEKLSSLALHIRPSDFSSVRQTNASVDRHNVRYVA